ncbi:hypothetical protein [Hydromonas duriensis]|uniref:Uncharacterized protein n=1 Tax=Hydromonas duriensis TaxID=1527608 RepID=A0A4R6Y9K0_9BURK|nr:hypothetical protein [Hydromonas duriensis]TDR32153.1 hypothetical protein DFR44_10536 [Hydromonas duriensis]
MRSDLTNHIYGVGSIFLGVVSLVVSFQSGTPFATVLLFASGWIVAAINTMILFKLINHSRNDGETIGRLATEKFEVEQKLLAENQRLIAISETLSTLVMGQKPAPRKSKSTTILENTQEV